MSISRWSRSVGTAVCAVGAFSAVTATSAFADYNAQYTYCVFGETGSARWHMPKDTDGILGLHGLWRDVHNNVVDGPESDYAVKGGTTVDAYGEGSAQWALVALVWNSDTLEKRGREQCQGDRTVGNALKGPIGDNVPSGLVPPPPAVQIVLPDQIA
jgi:hypothetical protein